MRRYHNIRFSNEWVFILDEIYKNNRYDETHTINYNKAVLNCLGQIAYGKLPEPLYWGIVTDLKKRIKDVKDPNSIKHLQYYIKFFEKQYNAYRAVTLGALALMREFEKNTK